MIACGTSSRRAIFIVIANRIGNLFAAKDCFLLALTLRLMPRTRRCRHRKQGDYAHHREQRHERVATLGSPSRDRNDISDAALSLLDSTRIYCGRLLRLWFVVFSIDSRRRARQRTAGALVAFTHRDRVFDLQSGVRQHQLFVRDAGHAKPSAQNIALVNRHHALIVFILNQGRVGYSILRTDDADVTVVRRRWSGDIDSCSVGVEAVIRRAHDYVARSRCGNERRGNRRRNLLRVLVRSRQFATINKDPHRGRELVARNFEFEVRGARVNVCGRN